MKKTMVMTVPILFVLIVHEIIWSLLNLRHYIVRIFLILTMKPSPIERVFSKTPMSIVIERIPMKPFKHCQSIVIKHWLVLPIHSNPILRWLCNVVRVFKRQLNWIISISTPIRILLISSLKNLSYLRLIVNLRIRPNPIDVVMIITPHSPTRKALRYLHQKTKANEQVSKVLRNIFSIMMMVFSSNWQSFSCLLLLLLKSMLLYLFVWERNFVRFRIDFHLRNMPTF